MTWPFDVWEQIAVRRFGITPDAFWALPLREWFVLLGTTRSAGCGRDELKQLHLQFPDEGDTHDD